MTRIMRIPCHGIRHLNELRSCRHPVAYIVRGGDRRINRVLKIMVSVHVLVMSTILMLGLYLQMSGANVSLGNMEPVTTLYRKTVVHQFIRITSGPR